MNLLFYIENKNDLNKISFENLLKTVYNIHKTKAIHKITFMTIENITKSLIDIKTTLSKDFKITERCFNDFENFKNKFDIVSKKYPKNLQIDKLDRFFYAIMEQESTDIIFLLSLLNTHAKLHKIVKNKNIKIFKILSKIKE